MPQEKSCRTNQGQPGCVLCLEERRHLICLSADIQFVGQGDMNKDTENSSMPNKTDDANPMCQLLENPPLRGIFIQPLSGAPVVFGIRSGRDLESIRMHIWKGGGKVEDPGKVTDTAGHRITLFDPNAVIRPKDKDIFDYQYILDCVRDNVLKENIIDYRINTKLVYEDYNPMDVLLGHKKWEDLNKRISLLDQTGTEEECSDIGKLAAFTTRTVNYKAFLFYLNSRSYPYF